MSALHIFEQLLTRFVTQLQIFGSTAGQEIRRAIDASGEPPMQPMRAWYDNIDAEPSSSAEFWDLCRRRQEYQEAYHKYWMSSRERSGSKRVVDGVIMPVAPSAAVEQGLFGYYGMDNAVYCFLRRLWLIRIGKSIFQYRKFP